MPVLRRFFSILMLLAASNCVVIAAVYHIRPGDQSMLYIGAVLAILLVCLFPARVRNEALRLRSIKKGHELIILFSVTFLINAAANIAFGVLLVPVYISLHAILQKGRSPSTSCTSPSLWPLRFMYSS